MAQSTQPLVTLSIVSHGHKNDVINLLASLSAHEEPNQLQIILTDNLGHNLPDIASSHWANLTILRNYSPISFARNHNQASKHALGKYFVVLNPDVVFKAPILDQLVHRLQGNNIDIIAPAVIDSNGNLQDSFRSLPTPWSLMQRRIPGHSPKALQTSGDGLIYPDWIAGIFLLMPRKVFESLEGFDERYTLYFEDAEFCIRAGLKKLRIAIDPDVSILHDAQRSSHSKLEYLLHHLRSAVVFFASETYKAAKKSR